MRSMSSVLPSLRAQCQKTTTLRGCCRRIRSRGGLAPPWAAPPWAAPRRAARLLGCKDCVAAGTAWLQVWVVARELTGLQVTVPPMSFCLPARLDSDLDS